MKKKLMSVLCAGLLLCSTGVMASAEMIDQNNQPQEISTVVKASHTHDWEEIDTRCDEFKCAHIYKCSICNARRTLYEQL